MPATATAQVNARISAQLKANGDEGLAAAGLTPTQAVRAVWDLAARYKNTPDKLHAALFPDKAEEEKAEAAAQKARRAKLIEEGSKIVERAYEKAGITFHPDTVELTDEELKKMAYQEKYGKEMSWLYE